MSQAHVPSPLDALLARREWVRRLARSLSRDDASADDLAQEGFLAAIEHPPAHADAPAGWLRRVLVRRAINRSRGERRRESRETAASRDEASPATDEVVAVAETHRRVVEAVMALEEPYRTTVLLRFFEDLPPRDVAVRMSVPVETVRSRVRRAVEQLRVRLDERHGGDRAAWLVPLMDSGRGDATPAPVGVAVKGVIAMTAAKKVALTVAVVLVAVAAVAVNARRAGVAAPAVDSARTQVDRGPAPPTRPSRTRAIEADTTADRDSGAAPVQTTSTTPANATPPVRELAVVVVDLVGKPVPNVRVQLSLRSLKSPVNVVTGDDGVATFRAAEEMLQVLTADEGQDGKAYRARSGGPRIAADAKRIELVVEPMEWISGTIHDEKGKPIWAEMFAVRDGNSVWNGYSDKGNGRFKIAVPAGTYAVVLRSVVGSGYPPPAIAAEARNVPTGAEEVALVARPTTGKRAVNVRIVTSDGRGLAGVRVVVRSASGCRDQRYGRSDGDGRVAFPDLPDEWITLEADGGNEVPEPWEALGWVPPAWERFVAPDEGETSLVFETGRPLRGRLEFPDDYPISGARKTPRAVVVVDQDDRTIARALSDDDRRFTVWVPKTATGPFRFSCGASEMEGKKRNFEAVIDGVVSDAADVVLVVKEVKR